MITNTLQTWEPGHLVRIGFLNLIVVTAVPTPGDHAPDAYVLTNARRDTFYRFVPHHGIRRCRDLQDAMTDD